MTNYTPAKLLEYHRDGLIEQEHSGFVLRLSCDGKIKNIGKDNKYPFYLRSCAKPLQASLLEDFGLIDFYKMTDAEIAICCASHTGEAVHTSAVESFLRKIGLPETDLRCGLHKPLSKTEKENLILNKTEENILQNNCSGKHVMMLAACKKMGYDTKKYDDINHPLQQKIKSKIYKLCELEKQYPITKDGCGVPIHSMPLENMLRGYLNLFFDPKYTRITQAFAKNPYLIGGEDRLDTAIMEAQETLVAKVGAGGICIVVNLKEKEAILVKISDCDMKARAIVTLETLNQLNWLDEKQMKHPIIQPLNKRDILTLHGEKIGEIKHCFAI